MKKPNEPGQGTTLLTQKKKHCRLTTLIVQAGIADSVHEAQKMLAAGEICIGDHNHGWPVDIYGQRLYSDDPSQYGRTMISEDTQVLHRSKCPKCAPKPIVFAKRDKEPSVSSALHSRVLNPASGTPDPGGVEQIDLEECIYRRLELAETEERIAVALSKGARVEHGVHVAELVPARNEDGRAYLKLVVR